MLIRKIVRYSYLGFYTLGFFVVLALGSLILIANAQANADARRLERLPNPDEWYLYQNDESSFSIWYPRNWTAEEIHYGSERPNSIGFQSADGSMGYSLELYSRGQFPNFVDNNRRLCAGFNSESVKQCTSRNTGGQRAAVVFLHETLGIEAGNDEMYVYIPYGDRVYNLRCWYSLDKRDEGITTCEDALETWEFEPEPLIRFSPIY